MTPVPDKPRTETEPLLARAEQTMRQWERGHVIETRDAIDLVGDLYAALRDGGVLVDVPPDHAAPELVSDGYVDPNGEPNPGLVPVSPVQPQDEPPLTRVEFYVCELCLTGAGGECHVPGCTFWMNAAPVGSSIAWLRDRSVPVSPVQPQDEPTSRRAVDDERVPVPLFEGTVDTWTPLGFGKGEVNLTGSPLRTPSPNGWGTVVVYPAEHENHLRELVEGASQPQPDTPDLTGLFAALNATKRRGRLPGDVDRLMAEVGKLRAATKESET